LLLTANRKLGIEMGKRRDRKLAANAVYLDEIRASRANSRRAWNSVEGWRDQRYVRNLSARTPNQARLIKSIHSSDLVFALGPAGTGKTYLAVSLAVEALEAGDVARIVLSRPAIEAGEVLGYLPGSAEDKLSPYLRPLYDALTDRMGAKRLRIALDDGTIEVAPIAFMRGRTLNNSFVVIDEAQNCLYSQLKMLLTRLGSGSTMVIAGDPEQSDLMDGMSGLSEIAKRVEDIDGLEIIRLNESDVVRHPLVAKMLREL
jgi:phosphate starvation-inducible PhoH-like protein